MAVEIKKISEQELDEQKQFADKTKALLNERYNGKQPLACVVTYGCQQNVADSEKIKGMLEEMGYGFTDDRLSAKLVIFNTCAVREHAEDRVFGNVGALKKYKLQNPDVIIALCGCMMQQKHIAEKIKKSFPFVDLVFGTHVVYKVPELVYTALTRRKRVFELPDVDGVIAEGIPVKRDNERKAWIPIMYGCNNFCSYCVVPYVRGRERSRQASDVINEFKQLVDEGYKEITLLGKT
jgi:tRNA-2-methylthio-N6-dimethylallyladenosine synthase